MGVGVRVQHADLDGHALVVGDLLGEAAVVVDRADKLLSLLGDPVQHADLVRGRGRGRVKVMPCSTQTWLGVGVGVGVGVGLGLG